MTRASAWPLAAWACLPAVLWAAPPESLARSARQVLELHCVECHGKARTSGLDLRTRESALQGGARGSAIVPGDPSSSLLLDAVLGVGQLKMPPGSTTLPEAAIETLKSWIDAGAQWADSEGPPGQSQWWAFKKPARPEAPSFTDDSWVRTPVDAFVLARLRERGLEPAPAASRRTLVRRAYLDLHGLPPSPEEVDRFLQDESPDAYEALVDRLLESERYGERWGRYWLDLVRYADTSGFETDHFYTAAWRYRDYVIESFNQDKPFTVFVQEQVAADELWPTDTDLEGTLQLPSRKQENVKRRIGTSLFTLGAFPIEYTFYGDLYRAEWRAEAIDMLGAAFLGLTLECARCHDHKSDPISQRDYYSLTAFFAGSVEQEIPLGSIYDVQTSTRRFPLLEQARVLKRMAKEASKDISESERSEMLERLGAAYLRAPDPYPSAKVLGHEERVPATYVLGHGDFRQRGERVEPSFPAALPGGLAIEEPETDLFVPRRRAALAKWLTSPGQPLLGRVMVNRIWQHHFGHGIVRTPSDFGRQGEPPTHPELLDWLAVEFAERGWSVKEMHRLIMASSTFRSASVASTEAVERDPGNLFLGRMNRRRLDADALRDSILAVSGKLNLKMGGVGVIPPLTGEEILAARMPYLWPANPDPAEHNRRSIYLQAKRSMAVPMLQIFDAPDTARSCSRRETSTVAPQALAMLNSQFVLEKADSFASRLREEAGEAPEQQVRAAWLAALGRPPDGSELQTAVDYLNRNSLPRLCLMLFNTNEFIYVD